MKIDIQSIDRTQFYVNEHVLNGELVYLVIPQYIGAKWNVENKVFRSSVWDIEGNLISAGFPKFVNFGESPEVFPVPTSLKNSTVVEKIDGSLLVVSKWKGQYILRTRGTVDATTLDNGFELEIFKENGYLNILDRRNLNVDTWDRSYLFEWTSPLQKIILDYGDKPDWYSVGVVSHYDYKLWTQDALDAHAKASGFKRPVTYTFTTIKDLVENVEKWKDREGVCLYSNNGQSIHKVKAAEYLTKHRFKSEANFENTMDLFFTFDKPNYQQFEANLIEKFDHECFEMVRGFASTICDGYKEVLKIVDSMKNFVANELSKYPTRKEQAMVTFQSYGKDSNRSSFIFKLLDDKELGNDDLKKLLYQVTKK